ncbi:MAG TPA: YtpI family protein [Pseudogracilibacillus sp.]|nr:YtpI family protein [Pseudogracilibacillus sp.]
MFIVAILILLAAVFYIYYKVSILRTKDSLLQKYTNAKSRICLGSFLFFFAINQYLAYQQKFVLIISLIFFVLGIMQIVDGWKEAKHYRSEWRRLYPSES